MVSTCRGCGAEIEWVKTPAGRNMPVDPGRVEILQGLHVDGQGKRGERRSLPQVTVVTDDGRVVTGVRVADVDQGLLQAGLMLVVTSGRVSHFGTCPHANAFRTEGRAHR